MIHYREVDKKCIVKHKKTVSSWVRAVVESYGKELGDVCVVSCSDKHLLGVNIEHLNHDYYTDIITFDYSDSEKISGDLLISFDRVGENAGDLGIGFQEELRRVIIHGVLHLVGLKDKSEKEAKEMRACENAALKMFHVEP